MIMKKGLAAVFIVVVSVTTVCCQQKPSSSPGVRQQQRPATAVPALPIPAPKRDEPNFDQQRLTALFGSQAQPVYGKRDPTTGQVLLEAAPPTGSVPAAPRPAINRFTPSAADEDVEDSADEEIDRKDTRVPETNEINPFELLPPQFHDLLNIPIHDYGNGTTFNPYDKYKAPAPKNKYPLVSTGYANTKYQGSPNPTTTKPTKPGQPNKPGQYDYDYDSEDYAPIKPFQRPPTKSKTNPTTTTIRTSTTTEDERYDDQYTDRPTTTTQKQRVRPSDIPAREQETFAVYRPKAQSEVTRRPRPPTYDENTARPDGSTLFREQTATYRPANIPDYKPDNRPDRTETKPEKRPESRPEYRPEFRPEKRPTTTEEPYYEDEETSQEQQTDNWPRPPEQPKPSKPASRPSYDEFSPYKPESIRPKPTFDEKPSKPQPTRPNYSVVAESNEPVFTPHDSYRPDEQIAEIKVTPKPFYAADDNQNFGLQPQQKTPGQVDDVPDIIYDYDDERSKGEGVLFMFDNSPSNVPSGPDGPSTPRLPSRPVTQSPVASPYPTVAPREPRPQQAFNPAFRPSAPVRQSSDSTFLPPPAQPNWNLPSQQKQQIGNDSPRPPFRFPNDQQQQQQQQPLKKENQPPNILPLFRPNTNPTDEFQFIKHPQQIEFQRQQPQPHAAGPQPFNQRPESPQRQRPTGISPLPSALQSPFSSISQAVANFFGRRSGYSSLGSQRSGNLDPTEKMDRSGIVDPTEMETDLDMAESGNSGSFVLFSRPDQPLVPSPIAIDRSGLSLQHPQPASGPVASPAAAHQQVVGIKVSPDAAGSKPPAFYVYTSRELEQGRPPYLVVGPVLSGPPNVAGAQLVHTAPAQPITSPESQRRNDFPVDGPNHPANPNSLPFPTLPTNQEQIPAARQPEVGPVRKPFFPISGSGNKGDRLPTGLSPPRQNPPPNRRPPPGFLFPENPQEAESVLPQGISPVSQGIPPPRVPLNPQKDVASPYSNPTLLHNRPSEVPSFESGSFHGQVTDHGLPVKNPDSSVGVASVLNVPLYEETITPRPPKRKTTKSPYRTTTTPAYMEAFNNPQPVTYATIQQEDGKQIAVVHPAYIVTYKPRPGPPELIDLDAPFIPSVESPSKEGEMSSIPFEKWHAMPQEIERKGEEAHLETSPLEIGGSHHIGHKSGGSEKLEYHGGFLPLIPERK